MTRLFSPGCLCITPGICEMIIEGADIPPFLNRHLCGDWGDICDEAKDVNNRVLVLVVQFFRFITSLRKLKSG